MTFEAHAADHGSIHVLGESGPVASVSGYYKEVKENGSFAFMVHADGGYEVEHVRFADTGADLQKNAQSLYEIAAVTRDVEITITYRILPQETTAAAVETEAGEAQTEVPSNEPETEEDPEAEPGTASASEESTETISETEENSEINTEAQSEHESENRTEAAAMLAGEDGQQAVAEQAGQITVKIEGVPSIETAKIDSGVIAEHLPEGIPADKYTFKYAKVGENAIFWAQKHEDKVYYKTDGAYIAAMELPEGEEIVLYYEAYKESYNISYTVDPEEGGTFNGPSTITEGDDLIFHFAPGEKYVQETIEAKTADGEELAVTPDAQTKDQYIVTGISSAVTVTAKVKKKTNYTLTLNGSNTYYVMGNRGFETGNDSRGGTVTAKCSSDTFTLQGNYWWNTNEKELNILTVKPESGNEEKIAIPGSGTATTKLPNGITISVSKSAEKKEHASTKWGDAVCSTYVYTVGIQNCYEDLTIYANHKDTSNGEIWVQQLTGVDPIYSVAETRDNKHTLNATETDYITEVSANTEYTFYAKAQAGYELADDETNGYGVFVSYDGGALGKIQPNLLKQPYLGYTHRFTVDSKNSSNIRIYIKAKEINYTYKVKYETGDSDTVITDPGEYKDVNTSFTVTRSIPVNTDPNKVFVGWTATAADGNTINIKPDSAQKFISFQAETDSEAKTATVTFTAKYEEVTSTTTVPYYIVVRVTDENGATLKFWFTESAYVNKTLLIDEGSLGQRVKSENAKIDLSEYTRTEGELKKENLQPGDTISLAYTRATADLTVWKKWQQPGGNYGSQAYKNQNATVTFTLYRQGETEAFRIATTTTGDSSAEFSKLPYGTYKVKETGITNADNYTRSTVSYTFRVDKEGVQVMNHPQTDGQQTKTITFYNDLKKATLTVKKDVDWKGTKVEPAEFTIQYQYGPSGSSASKIGTIVASVDNEGTIRYTQDGKSVTKATITVPLGTNVSVTEQGAGAWDTTINGKSGKSVSITASKDTDVVIKNERKLYKEHGKLQATKRWGIESGVTPDVQPQEVTVELYRQSVSGTTDAEVKGQGTQEPSSSFEKVAVQTTQNCSTTFQTLPAKDVQTGKDYVYVIREQDEQDGIITFTKEDKSSQYMVSYDQEKRIITNTYVKPGNVTLTLKTTKEVIGRSIGMYSFKVTAATEAGYVHVPEVTGSNDGNGQVSFAPLELSQTGKYKLTVSESSKDTTEITADKTTYAVTFTVVRGEDNRLTIQDFKVNEAEVSVRKAGGTSNTYEAEIPAADGRQAGFVNESKLGRLKLIKVLQDSDKTGEEEFTFTITAPDDVCLDDAGVTIKNGEMVLTPKSNSFTVTLKPQKTANGYLAETTVSGLPVGTYTVAENGEVGSDGTKKINGKAYAVTTAGTSAVTAGAMAEYTVTNTRKESNASLTITKSWKDWQGKETTKNLPEKLNVTVKRQSTTAEAEKVAVVALTGSKGWTDTLTGLEKYDGQGNEYTYTVTETVPDGYEAEAATVTATWDKEQRKYVAALTNSRTTGDKENGSLSITKTISAAGGVTSEMKNDRFVFTVQGPSDLTGNIAYTVTEDGKTVTSENANAKDGRFRIVLKDGQTATVTTPLPTTAGSEKYSVTEKEAEVNQFTYTAAITEPQALKKGGKIVFTAMNTLAQYQGELVISKEWQQPNGKSQEYTSGAYGTDGATATFGLYRNEKATTPYTSNGKHVTATTDRSGTAKFSNLPAGEYYVKEERQTADGYQTDPTVRKVMVPAEGYKTDDELIFRNDLTKTGNDLTITKTIDWNGTTPEAASFTITYSYKVPDGNEVKGTVTAQVGSDGTVTGYTRTEEGSAEVTGKGANVLQNLPYGTTVIIGETATGWRADGTGSTTVKGNTTVTVKNTRELYNGNGRLTVTKKFSGVTDHTEVKPTNLAKDISLKLLADNVEIETKSISAAEIAENKVINGSVGSVTFEHLPKYGMDGKPIRYTVKEVGENNNTITLEGTGGMKRSDYKVSYSYPSYQISYYASGTNGNEITACEVTNTYVRPESASLTVHAAKELTGGLVLTDSYRFQLEQVNSDPLQLNLGKEYKNVANRGSEITFPPIEITEPGEYHLRVTEQESTLGNVNNDSQILQVTVVAGREGDSNMLELSVKRDNELTRVGKDGVNAGTFTNTAKTGSLTLTKTIRDSGYREGSYTLVVTAAEKPESSEAAVDLSKATLMRNGTPVPVENNSFEVTLTPDTESKTANVTITGLPQGTYTVTEKGATGTGTRTVTVNGKNYLVTGEAVGTPIHVSEKSDVEVVNTRTEQAGITFTKRWKDADGNDLAAEMIPDSLQVTVKRRTPGAALADVKTVTMTKPISGNAAEWTTDFDRISLDMFDENGVAYEYFVTEAAVPGFKAKEENQTAVAEVNSGTGSYMADMTNVRDDLDPAQPTKEVTDISKKIEVTVGGQQAQQVAPGEEITYKVSYQNYLQTKATVTITDRLPAGTEFVSASDGGTLKNGTVTWTVLEVPAFQKGEVTITVKVTEEALDGTADPKIENTATVKIGDQPEAEAKAGPVPVYHPDFTVVKKLANQGTGENGAFKLNETAEFDIIVTNTGSMDLTNVAVQDVISASASGRVELLPGRDQSYTVAGETAVIAVLATGTSVTVKAKYTIVEADLGKKISNGAAVKANEKEGTEEPEPVDVPVESRNPSLKVEKEAISRAAAEDGKYVAGETITYQVTVTNDGNLTLKDINVQDIMTRPDGTQMLPSGLANGVQTIAMLAPGESGRLTYSHVVAEQDLGGELKNAATASGNPSIPNPDPEKPEPKPEDKDEETVTTTSKADVPETEHEKTSQSETMKTDSGKTDSGKTDSVKTGDDTPLMAFALLFLCSAACMLFLAGRRKKEDGQGR